MTTHYAMYRFNSKEQFESKKDAFNEEVTVDGHTFTKKPDHFIVGKGFKPVTEEVTLDDGSIEKRIVTEEITETIDGVDYTIEKEVVTEEYLVDVIWANIEADEESGKGKHPYGWKSYHVKPEVPLRAPLWGWKYVDNMEE